MNMDIKEAYDVLYEHLKEECYKQDDCDKCLYGADSTCGSLPCLAYERLGEFRKEYLKHLYDVNNSVNEDKNLINNPYFNRVYANKGDKVLCIDNGGSYTTYSDFFKQNNREDLLDKYSGWPLTVGKIYEIIDIYPHNDRTCNIYILKEGGNDNTVYLCTDNTDYLKFITHKYNWTDKSKQRVLDILFEVGHLEKYNFMFVEGGYLLLSRNTEFGHSSKIISNVPRMSSKAIKKIMTSYVNSLHGYL